MSFKGTKVTGIGFDQTVLEMAGIREAAAFAAVSSGDNSNVIAARVVRESFGRGTGRGPHLRPAPCRGVPAARHPDGGHRALDGGIRCCAACSRREPRNCGGFPTGEVVLAEVVYDPAWVGEKCIDPVTVVTSGPEHETVADGAFDLAGAGPGDSWRLPSGLPSHPAVIVDEVSHAVAMLLTDRQPTAVLFLSSAVVVNVSWRRIAAAGGGDGAIDLGLHVPVNRMAEEHRHHGFGFTGYQLVLLGDVDGVTEEPAREVKALGASFPQTTSSSWGTARPRRGAGQFYAGRSPWIHEWISGACSLTRSFVVDLAPGLYLARECVEALRFGAPIVVPASSSAAAEHALATGQHRLRRCRGAHHAAGRLRRASERSVSLERGRRYADERYGRPAELIERLGDIVSGK